MRCQHIEEAGNSLPIRLGRPLVLVARESALTTRFARLGRGPLVRRSPHMPRLAAHAGELAQLASIQRRKSHLFLVHTSG